jgi:hypothetical protein
MHHAPSNGVSIDDLVSECDRQRVSTSETPQNRRKTIRRALQRLIHQGHIRADGERIFPHPGGGPFPLPPGTQEPVRLLNEDPPGTE